jgi:hypothetical protein
MPTNLYFNNYSSKPEQDLYNSLINETVKIWGIDSYFMPRSSQSSVDLIFGDDPTKKFDEAYPVEVYVKNVDSFEGNELFSKFGLEIQHQISFLMTTDAFKRSVPSDHGRPKEGDLLWLTNFQALFEVKFVNQQHFFYAFGQKNFYGYELICERYRYDNEEIATGIIEIDDAADKQVFTYEFEMVSNGSGTYQLGEVIYQGPDLANAAASAIVVTWNLPTSFLTVKSIKGLFKANTSVIGSSSGASYMLYSYDGLNNTNNLLDNNTELGTLADQILDFSESNPFGDPSQVPDYINDPYTIFVNDNDIQTGMLNDQGQKVNFPIGTPKPKIKI